MDAEERASLAGLMYLEHFAAGTRIFRYGDAGESLFVIRQGASSFMSRTGKANESF